MLDPIRNHALTILSALDKGGATLDRLVEKGTGDGSALTARDRRFFNALVYGVLRWRGRIDWVVSQLSKTPLKKIDGRVLNILRLGLFQIMFMDRIPDSAAVNTSVELAKPWAPLWIVRYINGVLRNASRSWRSLTLPSSAENPFLYLEVAKSMPSWLVRRWVKQFGFNETARMCDTINEVPAITLRVNTLKIDRDHLVAELTGQAGAVQPTPFSPLGIHIHHPRGSVPELTGFDKGWFQVQDEAAQMVSFLLAPKAGETVLDACAGLGGKTAHLAQLMQNRGTILAVDRDPQRLLKLQDEMQRSGISIVTPQHQDLTSAPDDFDWVPFDRILLDAPCSGLGVLRRNPDGKWTRQPDDILRCHQRQLQLLEILGPLLKPGGTLVYAVCSLEPEETDHVVSAFLDTHPEFIVAPLPAKEFGFLAHFSDANGCLKTYPHIHDMDGFFCVRLKKRIHYS